MIAIILVGGKQSLVSEQHPDLPTPMIPIAGEPFLYWLTQWLKVQGIKHIVYSAGKHAEKISAWVNQMASLEPSLCLDVVTESRPLGTGGAASLCTQRHPSDHILITNGDSILLTNLRPAIKKIKQQKNLDGIVVAANVANAGRFGSLEIGEDKKLIAFKEKEAGSGPINAGIYLLKSSLFEEISSDKNISLEYDCFPNWLEQDKKLQILETDSPFIDIGTPDTLIKAEQLIQQHQEILIGQEKALAT